MNIFARHQQVPDEGADTSSSSRSDSMGLHRWISRVPGIARRPKAVVAVLLALAALLLVGQAAFAQTGPPALMSGDSVSISPGGGVIFPGQSVGLSATEYADADYSWSSDGASFSPSDASGTTMTVNERGKRRRLRQCDRYVGRCNGNRLRHLHRTGRRPPVGRRQHNDIACQRVTDSRPQRNSGSRGTQ